MDNGNPQARLEKAARCLKVLAHPTRLHIIYLLGHGEQSVHELEKQVQAQSDLAQRVSELEPVVATILQQLKTQPNVAKTSLDISY